MDGKESNGLVGIHREELCRGLLMIIIPMDSIPIMVR